jgi:hypothetical protein
VEALHAAVGREHVAVARRPDAAEVGDEGGLGLLDLFHRGGAVIGGILTEGGRQQDE